MRIFLEESPVFKERFLELIGKSKADVLSSNPGVFARIEGQDAERFFWRHRIKDSETGVSIPILMMVRFYRGRAWAVGIRSEDYFFMLNNKGDSPHLTAVPKKPEEGHEPDMVNWVARKPSGYYNHGVSY